jgi:hypothetical protein
VVEDQQLGRPVILSIDASPHLIHRLLQILRKRIPDITQEDYLRVFEHRTINDPVLRGRTVVVLGDTARMVMDLPPLFLHPQIIDGVTWRQIPHPEDLWSYDDVNSDLVAMLLESLYVSWENQNVRV